jgi:hypothetical protein
MVRVASRVSVVRNGGRSSSMSQPSVVRIFFSSSKRLDAFDSAPRPLCCGSGT